MNNISKTSALLVSVAGLFLVPQNVVAATSASKLENKGYICFNAGSSNEPIA